MLKLPKTKKAIDFLRPLVYTNTCKQQWRCRTTKGSTASFFI